MSDTLRQLGAMHQQLTRFSHNIEEALEYAEGTHTLDDVVQMVLSGQLLFLPFERSFLITEVITYPRYKVLNVFLGGGDLDEIATDKMQDLVLNMARHAGCSKITMSGRRGWEKPLRNLGWRNSHVTLVCEVGD